MKTNQLKLAGFGLTFALLVSTTHVNAQDVTIKNDGKTTSIKTDGSNVSVTTNKRSGTSRKTRITTGKPTTAGRGGTITVVQNRTRLTYDLTGESLTVSGNNNDILVRGECRQLSVNGNGNTIRLEAIGAISTMGNKNQVKWRTGNPSVSNLGSDNAVSREESCSRCCS